MSALSEACPVCGTYTNDSKNSEDTSSINEVEECGQASNVKNETSSLRKYKKLFGATILVFVFLSIVYMSFRSCNNQEAKRKFEKVGLSDEKQMDNNKSKVLNAEVINEITEDAYDIAYNVLSSKNRILPSDEKRLVWAISMPSSHKKKILALVGPQFISLDFIFDFITIENVGGNWQISNIDTQKIGSGESAGINYLKASEFQMKDEEMPKYVELNNNPYIFFMCREGNAGNAMPICYGTLYFALYNLKTREIVTLDFECWLVYSEIEDKHLSFSEGKFVRLEETKKHAIESDYLLKQAELSPHIYRPTKDDLNLDLPQNAVKKWLRDNPEIENLEVGGSKIIEFTYYDRDEHYEKARKDSHSVISSEDYEIFYSWRGSVYGFDKKKQKYFVIYGHESNWGAYNVFWINESTIEIDLYSDVNLVVDLNLGNVKAIVKY